MKNPYEVREDVTAIFIRNEDWTVHEALISTVDLPKVLEYPGTWGVHSIKLPYVRGFLEGTKGRKRIYLHRIIANAPKDSVVDHINNNKMDNRRENIRIITQAENNQNRKGAQRNSLTGVRGVTWDKQRKKYRAYLNVNNKRIYAGAFDDIKDAEEAAKKARAIYMPYSKEGMEARNEG